MSSPVATTPLTYDDYVTQVAQMAVVSPTDTNFLAILPQMLNYAELRIQRDADLLPFQTSLDYTFTSGNNVLTISVNDFVTIQTLSVNGTPLTPVSKEWLQNVYPSSATTGQPAFFAMIGGDQPTAGNTSTLIMVGPPPDSAYPVEIFGSIRMPSLYLYAGTANESTGTTFISTWLPDLLIMASMVYASAYQRNWGRQSDDPQMGLSYEAQYQTLLRGAQGEEGRKRFASSAWSSMAVPTNATPSR